MEAIKQSIQELNSHFNTKMAEFQQNLSSSIPATSPLSNVTAQFSAFRSFVLAALEGLQKQVELLTSQLDHIETRSRRKMLLIHGVPEEKNENVSTKVTKVLTEHLQVSNISSDDVGRCHRLGTIVSEKPRAILLKFKDLSLKNQVWFSKTRLKNTGVTVSEFLTPHRRHVFMAARQCFGVTKCWTKDGHITVIGPDGKRHSITSVAEINNIAGVAETQKPSEAITPATTSGSTGPPGAIGGARHKNVGHFPRPKRNASKIRK